MLPEDELLELSSEEVELHAVMDARSKAPAAVITRFINSSPGCTTHTWLVQAASSQVHPRAAL